jgi:hypothetical protein
MCGSELETLALRISVFEVHEEEKPKFQLIFLKDDEEQSVEVVEVEKIVFTEVEKHLEQGESVFITTKQKKKLKPNLIASKESQAETLYFSHI